MRQEVTSLSERLSEVFKSMSLETQKSRNTATQTFRSQSAAEILPCSSIHCISLYTQSHTKQLSLHHACNFIKQVCDLITYYSIGLSLVEIDHFRFIYICIGTWDSPLVVIAKLVVASPRLTTNCAIEIFTYRALIKRIL